MKREELFVGFRRTILWVLAIFAWFLAGSGFFGFHQLDVNALIILVIIVLLDYTKAPDSETYFMDLMQLESAENLSWYAFSGGGVGAATDSAAFSQGGFNVWNVIAGLDENASDETPFLFTRNLNMTMDDLRNEKVDLRSRLDPEIKPFGKILVVWVTKSGAVRSLKAKQLTRENFFGDGVFNTITNRNATIFKAKVLPIQ